MVNVRLNQDLAAKLVRNIIAGIGKRRLAQDGKETKQIVTLLGSPWDSVADVVRCSLLPTQDHKDILEAGLIYSSHNLRWSILSQVSTSHTGYT